jgi:hypothetical protein
MQRELKTTLTGSKGEHAMRKQMVLAGMVLTVAAVLLVVGPVSVAAQPEGSGHAAGADGKAIFLAQKCNMCHDVSTAEIAATAKSEKVKGPDLVNLKPDADFWMKYLKKQADLEGKKHSKNFTGNDADLNVLVDWMMAQKK